MFRSVLLLLGGKDQLLRLQPIGEFSGGLQRLDVRIDFGAPLVRRLDIETLQRIDLALGEQRRAAVVELLHRVVGRLAGRLGRCLDEATRQDVASSRLDLLDDLRILVELGRNGLLGDDLFVDQLVEHLLGGGVAGIRAHATLLLQRDRQLARSQLVAIDLGDHVAPGAISRRDILLLATAGQQNDGHRGHGNGADTGAAGHLLGTHHRREPLMASFGPDSWRARTANMPRPAA